METFLLILGWVAAVLGAALAMPQVVRLMRASTSQGASLMNWQLVAGSGLAWTVYGIGVAHANVWVPNLFMAICGLIIIYMICKDRQLSLLKSLWVPAAVIEVSLLFWWAGVALLGDALGNAVFGFVVNIPQMVGMIAQMRTILTEPSIEGLSVGWLVMVTGVQYLWFIWGILTPDYGLVAGAAAMGTLGTIAIIILALRKAGRVGPKDAVAR